MSSSIVHLLLKEARFKSGKIEQDRSRNLITGAMGLLPTGVSNNWSLNNGSLNPTFLRLLRISLQQQTNWTRASQVYIVPSSRKRYRKRNVSFQKNNSFDNLEIFQPVHPSTWTPAPPFHQFSSYPNRESYRLDWDEIRTRNLLEKYPLVGYNLSMVYYNSSERIRFVGGDIFFASLSSRL